MSGASWLPGGQPCSEVCFRIQARLSASSCANRFLLFQCCIGVIVAFLIACGMVVQKLNSVWCEREQGSWCHLIQFMDQCDNPECARLGITALEYLSGELNCSCLVVVEKAIIFAVCFCAHLTLFISKRCFSFLGAVQAYKSIMCETVRLNTLLIAVSTLKF